MLLGYIIRRCFVLLMLALAFFGMLYMPPLSAITLEQVVSREDPAFNISGSRMQAGRDGLLYFSFGGNPGYVLRIARDGSSKLGGPTVYAVTAAAANAAGIFVTGNAHFSSSVNLYSPTFQHIIGLKAFINNDTVGYDSPCSVEAGEEDFYAAGQHENRIVRFSAAGKMLITYPLHADDGVKWNGYMQEFRVSEKLQRFYWLVGGVVHCVDWNGKTQWSSSLGIGGNMWDGYRGGFDVDSEGRLYYITDKGGVVKTLTVDGKPDKEYPLKMGENSARVMDLRIFKNEAIIKRYHPIELFQVYDLNTGAFKYAYNADAERLAVTFPNDIWTAGSTVPLDIDFMSSTPGVKPQWRVWIRPFDTPGYDELLWKDGQVQIPAGYAGLYQLLISPGVRGSNAEYQVQTLLEIRSANAKGSATAMTPVNRRYYGRGEAIPVEVILRSELLPKAINLRLMQNERTIIEGEVAVSPDGRVSAILPASLTAHLQPGKYQISLAADGLSCSAQQLIIGPGANSSPQFFTMLYGDYGQMYPTGSIWNVPELVAGHLSRADKLDLNLFVNRTGNGPQMGSISYNSVLDWNLLDIWKDRLTKDPLAVAPEKAQIEPPLLQSVAGYGAIGAHEMAILMYMDAGLPMGTGFDKRTPEQFASDITKISEAFKNYPAFRGWSWAANSWFWSGFGADAAKTPEQKAAYLSALKVADDTGEWNDVLDEVSNYWLAELPTATQFFNRALQAIIPGAISTSAGPYRSPAVYPPVTYKTLDEVDLHYQAEQIAPPMTHVHAVDFMKRPGKRAWGHPELWNDYGTGDQILPTLFMMAARGADGIGCSGLIPYAGRAPEDARSPVAGYTSVFRALNQTMRGYGSWLMSMEAKDPVAIICSGRMFRIDDWGNVGGKHFTRLYEAYNACLAAHYPASFVFVEDLVNNQALSGYKIILLVNQRVEMEPELKRALAVAAQAGSTILYDGNSRKELMEGFVPVPLNTTFNMVEKDENTWQDDSAYLRIPSYFQQQAELIKPAFAAICPPIAEVNNPAIFLSERKADQGSFLFVVNNSMPDLEPGLLWRVANATSTRLPIQQKIKLNSPAKVIYDVFAMKAITPAADGSINVDLRSLPARLYALFPAEISEVAVRLSPTVNPGSTLNWSVWVRDNRQTPIKSNIPIQVRLLAADGSQIDELYTTAKGMNGVKGSFNIPLNIANGNFTLNVKEMISGITTVAPVTVTGNPVKAAWNTDIFALDTAANNVSIGKKSNSSMNTDDRFGVHVRDIALSTDGKQLLLNAMNWGDNLYSVDIAKKQVVWQQRAGHHFAYAPQAVGNGFAVQGYDLLSAEGYQLYLYNQAGNAERRFSLYGLPKRPTGWAGFGQLTDHVNNFATAPDASWVASAGNLGLVVWDRAGKLLWSQDFWEKSEKIVRLIAANNNTLLVLDGMSVTAYLAITGEQRWQKTLAVSGELQGGTTSADGRTCALWSTTNGGRVYILREDKLITSFPTATDAISLSADGEQIVLVEGKQVKWYSVTAGLQWSFTGDDFLRLPRITADGKRMAVGSELGTLYVIDSQGNMLSEVDLQAFPVAAWLPDGGLVAATWQGSVYGFNAELKESWHLKLPASTVDVATQLLRPDNTPTTRVTGWGNADPAPRPITDNLLKETNAFITFVYEGDRNIVPQAPVAAMVDGLPDAPEKPWLSWSAINGIDSGWSGGFQIYFDSFRTQMKVSAITFVEDPKHPESWMRNAILQYWDAEKESWEFGAYLLSDSATHSHTFAKPLESARFRIISTAVPGTWPAGNIRWGEVVFHGETAGCSHPDVVAKRPLAVLYDEKQSSLRGLMSTEFKFDGAYSGGQYLQASPGRNVVPNYVLPFGHALPNWDFEIVENPQPGQYRWLQFAWKALSPETTGMAFLIGKPWPGGGYNFVAGKFDWGTGVLGKPYLTTAIPGEWTVVKVDLWAMYQQPVRIQCMLLASVGGPCGIDQIVVGRSEADLPAPK